MKYPICVPPLELYNIQLLKNVYSIFLLFYSDYTFLILGDWSNILINGYVFSFILHFYSIKNSLGKYQKIYFLILYPLQHLFTSHSSYTVFLATQTMFSSVIVSKQNYVTTSDEKDSISLYLHPYKS